MKEEWLMAGAVVPVDVETTAALVAEIHRLIDVVGGLVLKQALAAPVQPVCPACESIEWEGQPCQICQPTPAAQRQWVGLTVLEQADCFANTEDATEFYHAIEAKLKEKNT